MSHFQSSKTAPICVKTIEIKLRSGIFILVSVSAIESIATTFKQLA
jgi:hypothetical protein